MPRFPRPRRVGAVAIFALVASLFSCGREITGPMRGQPATVAFAPRFATAVMTVGETAHSVASLVPFDRVRIVLRRAGEEVAVRLVSFPAGADSVELSIPVTLSGEGGSEGEIFEATLKYINAQGDTVFSGGPVPVMATPGTRPGTPSVINVTFVGPGSNTVRVDISPDSLIANSGTSTTFTATAFDAQSSPVSNAIVGFVSRNPALVSVPNLGSGAAQLVGVRGTTYVVAQHIGGAIDSAKVTVNPVPSMITRVSGDAQQTLASTPFPQPLRVRVLAVDGLGVAGWPVAFSVASGGGILSLPSAGGLSSLATEVLTDASGFAEVLWTAGATAGAATVTASITGPTSTVTFTGTQLSADPTSLEFTSAVGNIAAGTSFANLSVRVRNGTGAVATNFTGPVALALNGGTAGAEIVGIDTVNAIAGIATFSEFTVNRAGTGYFFTAKAVGFPGVGTSSTFSVSPAPADLLTLVSGGGQSAPANVALADSIRIRVTDQFGFAVSGQTVTFTVTAGGGAVFPATAVTDADGRAATQWLLGSAGVQTIEASLGSLESIVVTATVVGGFQGSVQLFAGFDYTSVPAGRSAQIPIYLSSPAINPITITLTSDDTLAVWGSSTVVIPAGTTRLDVPITGLVPSSSWAYMSSSAGNDSVLVSVDSAWVTFAPMDFFEFLLGDTIQSVVLLSDPAPAGGVLVTVRSLDPSIVRVAPSSGKGTPVPSCVSVQLCFGLRAPGAEPVAGGESQILAPFADSAQFVIPEGRISAMVAFEVVGDGGGSGFSEIEVSAPAHVSGGGPQIQVVRPTLAPENSPITLSSPLGIGQTFGMYFRLPTGAASREHAIAVVSRNPSIVSVEDTARVLLLEVFSSEVRVVGLTAGSAWIVYSSPAMATDSTLITVSAPAIDIVDGVNSAPGSTIWVPVRVTTPGSTEYRVRVTDLPLTMRVTNPSVVVLEQYGAVLPAGEIQIFVPHRFVGVGTSWIVVEAAGHAADSIQVASTAPGFFTAGTPATGVGLTVRSEIFVQNLASMSTTTTITVTSLNPEIVRVLTPQLELNRGSWSSFVTLEGVAPGTGFIRLTGADFVTTNIPVNVGASTFALTGFTTLLVPDPSLAVPISGITQATALGFRSPADTVLAILRSSNPAILLVTDSTLRFNPGEVISVEGGTVQPVAPGIAQLTLHAPQFTSSVPVSMTVLPFALTVTAQSSLIGTRHAIATTIRRNTPTAGPLAVAMTKSGLGDISVLQGSIIIPADSDAVTVDLVGQVAGVLELEFSAPGLAPSTLAMTVDPSTLGVIVSDATPTAGYLDTEVFPLLRLGESATRRRPGQTMRFALTSSDTTKIRVLQDTVEFAAGVLEPTRAASIRYLQGGNATLTFKSVDGFYPDVTRAMVIDPAELTGSTSYANDAFVIGMNQEAYLGEVSVDRGFRSDEPMWVHLSSSVPGLVTLPDSVLIPAGERDGIIALAAGDSIGSARITASAPGWNPWEFDLFVTRTMLQPNFDDGFVGGRTGAELYLMDMLTYYSRPLATDIPLRLSVEDSTFAIFEEDTLIFPQGEETIAFIGPRGLRVGRGSAYVSDARTPGFNRITRGGNEFNITRPAVSLAWPRYQATPGLRVVGEDQAVGLSNGQDSTVLRFSSLGGRFSPAPDSLLVERFAGGFIPPTVTASFSLAGISAGIDTLVVESNGFISDSAVVSIEPGILRALASQVQTIRVGDSVRVVLQLRSPAGWLAETTTNQLLSFSTGPTFVVSNGTVSVSTINVPTGQTQVEFWVRGVSAGTGDLLVSGANFRPLRLLFTTRTP